VKAKVKKRETYVMKNKFPKIATLFGVERMQSGGSEPGNLAEVKKGELCNFRS